MTTFSFAKHLTVKHLQKIIILTSLEKYGAIGFMLTFFRPDFNEIFIDAPDLNISFLRNSDVVISFSQLFQLY